ncbi:MAG: phage Gp37/Gp68 family protein [Desulfovibrionaceae bacterium]
MTKIEWTDATLNPIIGCTKCSPACDHCYAERMAARLATMPNAPKEYREVITDGRWNGQVRWVGGVLDKALHWRKPRKVFIGSMTDIFHPAVPFEWVDKIMAVAALTPHITWQVLTKRPERMREYMADGLRGMHIRLATSQYSALCRDRTSPIPFPLHNVWLGTTIWDQDSADKSVPVLLDTPAALRFVSVEPMLGAVDLQDHIGVWGDRRCPCCLGSGQDDYSQCGCCEGKGRFGLDWVICGGETGPGARATKSAWAKSLRDQCADAGVPFFFKKMGGKDKSDLLDGRQHHEFPREEER